MKSNNDLSDLERYAGKCIAAHRYPSDVHMFSAKKCPTCGIAPFELTIEHHSGSKKKNFRGVILGTCIQCDNTTRIFSFTGDHRTSEREEKPVCKCGSAQFLVGECERIERDEGLLGFFDEGWLSGNV